MHAWPRRALVLFLCVSPLLAVGPEAAAQVCGSWEWANPVPSGNILYDVTWGDGRFVTVGEAGMVMTSSTGSAWTIRDYGTTSFLKGVAWGDSMYVAVGESGTILTSPDGTTWTQRSSPWSMGLKDVTWGGGLWVAVGAFGRILSSTSGTSWNDRGDHNTYGLEGVASNGALFVAVGGDPAILTSSNGSSWTSRDTGGVKHLKGVVWTGSQFVAVGGNKVLTSSDGMTWTQQTVQVSGLENVTWAGALLVAVGSSGRLYTSAGGAAWNQQSSGTSRALYSAASDGSRTIAVGYDGAMISSTDGATWNPEDSSLAGVGDPLREVVWVPGGFVAVGSGGTILTSPDGHTWTARTSGTSESLGGVAWIGSLQVVVGVSGTVLTSPNGVTWTARDPGTTANIINIAASPSLAVAVGGDGTILTSPDGVDWTSRSSSVTDSLQDVVWSGSQFVAVGSYGAIATSPDGVAWTARSNGYGNHLRGIAWSGSRFVAVADGDTIFSSPDGVSWSYHLVEHDAFDVTWTGTNFVAVGEWGSNPTSATGTSWTEQLNVTNDTLFGVAWNGQRLVAVGEEEIILVSDCADQAFGLDSIAPVTGPASGGTEVTLTGRGFTADCLVSFGGTPATPVTHVGATTLRATTPANDPGAVDVTVTAADNRTTTLIDGFTYVDAPPTTLYLQQGRFAVTVDYYDQHNDRSGEGQAVAFADKTGFFWFFNQQNIELVVKILDGSALNGHYWVLYGALSDVEYWIEVTDTQTAATQSYHNEPGSICGAADNTAFMPKTYIAELPVDGSSGIRRGRPLGEERVLTSKLATTSCGTAYYDDTESEGAVWFGGGQADDPDYMFAVYFDLDDFGFSPGEVELRGFCAGNDIDYGGPWPNEVFVYPAGPDSYPDDWTILAQGTIYTGDGSGQYEVLVDPPVTLNTNFWLVNRGDQRWSMEDFNMEFDDGPAVGHSFASSSGISGLATPAATQDFPQGVNYILHADLRALAPSPPTADFDFSPASPTAGQAVQFTDQSTGSPTSWSWAFGDGGAATTQNPSHTFAGAGTYTVSLTATNSSGSDTATETVTVQGTGACVPDAETLCLQGGRFAVTVDWHDQHNDRNGVGTAVSRTDRTGLFWFFNDQNIELLVKVLDGTAINGHFWVFYGALSDVEYWIEVTDTDTQTTKNYHNPPGNICGAADTGAF